MFGRIRDMDLRATRRVGRSDLPVEPHSEQPTDPASGVVPIPLPASAEPAPGWLVGGRYRLERQLNSGGMGTVHLAQPIGGNQKVVVKFPHAHLVESHGFRERFEHEIRALQKLTHPHVVEIYDAGTEIVREAAAERELPYLVVRYMGGGSLKDRIAQAGGRLRSGQLQWLPPIASALDFIHSQNVVHRDVKPENLLFDVHGTVYLTDFGIAKLIGADSEISLDVVLGSPSYMAPEAMRRSPEPDACKMDQYSLAVVVYHALCGAFPHSGDSVTLLLTNKQTHAPSPIGERLPELPKSLVDALMRGLALEPRDRFESCGAFADAVLAAARPLRRRRRRWPLVVAASIALGAAGTYGYLEAGAPAAATRRLGTLGELVGELRARGDAARTELARLQGEVDAIADLARKAETNAGPPHSAEIVAVDASALAQVNARLEAVADAIENTDTARRVLAALRGGIAPLAARIEAARRDVDERRAEIRARGDRLFELRLRVAQLESQAGSSARDRRPAEIGREVATLEERKASDDAVLARIDVALDATRAKLAAVALRLDRDERSVADQVSRLEQAQRALRAQGAQLRAPAVAARPAAPFDAARARAALKLVAIPAGAFLFGCDPAASGACDTTLHAAGRSVSLPSFAIDRSEVSVAEYRECVRADVCTPPQGLSGAECNFERTDREDHPVNCVRFDQARTYCDWVGKALPTEEQWEKAARGEGGAPFPWGADPPDCERAVHAGCARTTAPIESGSAQRNANGLYHMAGNVWEWTRTPDTNVRQVVRGGSFRSNGKGLRSDRRISTGRTTSPDGAGLRCVKD